MSEKTFPHKKFFQNTCHAGKTLQYSTMYVPKISIANLPLAHLHMWFPVVRKCFMGLKRSLNIFLEFCECSWNMIYFDFLVQNDVDFKINHVSWTKLLSFENVGPSKCVLFLECTVLHIRGLSTVNMNSERRRGWTVSIHWMTLRF